MAAFDPRSDALLLGAGFSYEACMPLGDELTVGIRRFLSPQLRQLARRRHDEQDPKHPISQRAFDKLTELLADKSLNYEQIVAELLKPRYPGGSHDDDMRDVAQWVQQAAEVRLRELTLRLGPVFDVVAPAYKGVTGLATGTERTEIFSLNHDLLVEHLAQANGIDVDCGYSGGKFTVYDSRRGRSMDLDLISRIEGRIPLRFNRPGPGFNLLKLHGSLDLFAHGDRDNYTTESFAKLASTGNEGHLQRYKWLIEEAQARGPDGSPIRVLLDHVVNGEVQMEFLRSSILTGVDKFKHGHPGYALPEALELMESRLASKRRLITIGYSFRDPHINEILTRWSQSGHRELVAVGPSFSGPPTFTPAFQGQVEVWRLTATECLLRLAGMEWTPEEQRIRDFVNQQRNRLREIVNATRT